MPWKLTALLLFLAGVVSVCLARARTDLLNVCMDAKHHKVEPGPEDELHDQVRREGGLRLGRGLGRTGKGSGGGRGRARGQTPTTRVLSYLCGGRGRWGQWMR